MNVMYKILIIKALICFLVRNCLKNFVNHCCKNNYSSTESKLVNQKEVRYTRIKNTVYNYYTFLMVINLNIKYIFWKM